MATEEGKRKYAAFISYRHVSPDSDIAQKIHTGIEHFKVPEEYREAFGDSRLGLAFRDVEELPASSNLSDDIKEALENSRFLIVVCTPETPSSVWVEKEITLFMEDHPRDHVLAVLAGGTPETSFPKPLLERINEQGEKEEVEPLAANLTEENGHYSGKIFRREITRIYAAILGCPFDALWQRERRYRTRRLTAILGAGLALSLAFLGVVITQNSQIRTQNEQILTQNEQIMTQNRQIEEDSAALEDKNQKLEESDRQIREQLEELKERENIILTDQGNLLLEKGDRGGALKSAVEALDTSTGDRPYYAGAEALLTKALSASDQGCYFNATMLLDSDSDIHSIAVSSDGSIVVMMDKNFIVSCYDTKTGERKWQYLAPYDEERLLSSSDAAFYVDTEGHNLRIDEVNNAVLLTLPKAVFSVSLDTGEEKWSFTNADSYMRTLSPDGKQMMIMNIVEVTPPDKIGHVDDRTVEIKLIDLADGKTIANWEPVLPNDEFNGEYVVSKHYAEENPDIGVFSKDGSSFAVAVGYESREELESWSIEDRAAALIYYRLDLNDKTVSTIGGEAVAGKYSNNIYGMYFPEGKDLTVYRYDWAERQVIAVFLTPGEEAKQSEGWPINLKPFFNSTAESGDRYCLLPGEKYTVLSVNDIMLIYKTSTGEYWGKTYLGSDIVALYWSDPDQKHINVITKTGGKADYELEDEDNEYGTLFASIGHQDFLTMGEIAIMSATPALFPVEEEDTGYLDTPLPDASIVTVRMSDLKEAIIFRPTADPHREAVNYDEDAAKAKWDEIRAGQQEEIDPSGRGYVMGLCIRTDDGKYEASVDKSTERITITDITSGSVMYSDSTYIDDNLMIWNDTPNDRLYVGDGYYMICLDTRSNTVLFSLTGVEEFVPDENRLIVKSSSEKDVYYSFPAYTTDELVEWGKNRLQGKDK